MNVENLTTEKLVDYINQELSSGRTMIDIESNDFKVNYRVITKRLIRKGYKRVGDEFILNISNSIKHKESQVIQKDDIIITAPKSNDIQKYNERITNEKLIELMDLVEPIKEMLEEYNINKNMIYANTIELRAKATGEVKQKLFKVDVNVLDLWEEFVKNHKEFKVQQLISLALEEFIQKYN